MRRYGRRDRQSLLPAIPVVCRSSQGATRAGCRWTGQDALTSELPIEMTVDAMDRGDVAFGLLSASHSPREGPLISNDETSISMATPDVSSGSIQQRPGEAKVTDSTRPADLGPSGRVRRIGTDQSGPVSSRPESRVAQVCSIPVTMGHGTVPPTPPPAAEVVLRRVLLEADRVGADLVVVLAEALEAAAAAGEGSMLVDAALPAADVVSIVGRAWLEVLTVTGRELYPWVDSREHGFRGWRPRHDSNLRHTV